MKPFVVLLLSFAASKVITVAAYSDCGCQTDVCGDEKSKGVCGCASECPFSTLEMAMNTGQNQYKLYTTFHHPRGAFPQMVLVRYALNDTYDCSVDLNCTTYIWTSNSIYLVIRPHVFGLLTLFLGLLDNDHTGCVNLTIPEKCKCWLYNYETEDENSTLNYLEVLTEKVHNNILYTTIIIALHASIKDSLNPLSQYSRLGTQGPIPHSL